MNIQFRSSSEPASSAGAKAAIADCDIHPARATATELYPYLAKRWHAHLETYGVHQYQGMMGGPPYPKAQPNASRRDAYPPEGGPQGSSLSFMQQQHLDPNNVALGVLNPLNTGQGIRNHELSAALASAINDWQIEKWTSKDSRLKGSIVVANEDGMTAAAEIRKRAGDKNFDRLRSEVPHLKRRPSEYIRDHVWWTTQPMEDPERRDHLFELIEWIGWDKLLFATDYPHWDFDDPSRVLPAGVSDANKQAFYLDNAKKLYGIS